jgi:predicted RNase H-like HicB family nuclease
MKVTATVERGTGWWVVEVPEIQGLHTQARRLDQVAAMVRDAASLLTGQPSESFNVELAVVLPEALSENLARRARAAAEAREAQAKASALTRESVRELAAEGLTSRDIGQLLGVSYQRAAQLLAS